MTHQEVVIPSSDSVTAHKEPVCRDLPRLASAVVVIVTGLSIGFLSMVLSERAARWQVYPLAGALLVILALVGNTRRTLLIYYVLTLQIGVYVWVTQPQTGLYVGSSGPQEVSIPLGVLVGLPILAWQLLTRGSGRRGFRWGEEIGRAALCYMAITTLSMLVSNIRFFGFCLLVQLFELYLIFLITLNALRTEQDLKLVINLLLLTLAVQCGVFFLQDALGMNFTPTGKVVSIYGSGAGEVRASGTVGTTPSGFATFVEPILLMAFCLYRTAKSGRTKITMGALTVGALFAVILTLNRSSWFGIVIGLAIAECLCRRSHAAALRSSRVLALGAALAAIVVVVAPAALVARLNEDHSGDVGTRSRLVRQAASMIADNPVLGVGPGAYPYNLFRYADGGGWNYVVHNEFLLIWAERGIFGLLAWIVLLRAAFRRGASGGRTYPTPYREVAIAFQAAVIVYAWETCWNSNEPFPSQAIIWLLLGFLVAVRRVLDESGRLLRQPLAATA